MEAQGRKGTALFLGQNQKKKGLIIQVEAWRDKTRQCRWSAFAVICTSKPAVADRANRVAVPASLRCFIQSSSEKSQPPLHCRIPRSHQLQTGLEPLQGRAQAKRLLLLKPN
ncbi:hypothetical protein KRP22_009188 [Phytophthora ramorum]|nr:hypothetical protein KRP22_8018 [Phytophthora ramorum]